MIVCMVMIIYMCLLWVGPEENKKRKKNTLWVKKIYMFWLGQEYLKNKIKKTLMSKKNI